MNFLPPVIWSSPWTPAPTASSYTISEFDSKVYRAANRANLSARLRIYGRNVAEMASVFDAKIATAVSQGDFSEVLSPVRDFQM
jgi:hypothetical protein